MKLFSGLDEGRQKALLEYASFLYERSEKVDVAPEQPEIIARPDDESVVGAIKRLSASYPMLDKQYMLHEISGLMAQHMLQGRAAKDVIDEIEVIFLNHYQKLQTKEAE